MHLNHPVALRQLTELRTAELRSAAAPRHPRGGRRRRLKLRFQRLIVLRAPAS
jgi:hypothetical protein